MRKTQKAIHFEIPVVTHRKLEDYARNIGDISNTDRPKVATAIRRTLRVILDLHSNEALSRNSCYKEGGDTLSFIQKCVRRISRSNPRVGRPSNSRQSYSLITGGVFAGVFLIGGFSCFRQSMLLPSTLPIFQPSF